jgi:hypothetical protein
MGFLEDTGVAERATSSKEETIAGVARRGPTARRRVPVAVDEDDLVEVLFPPGTDDEWGTLAEGRDASLEEGHGRGSEKIAPVETHGRKILGDREPERARAPPETGEKRSEKAVVGANAGQERVLDHHRIARSSHPGIDDGEKKGVGREKRPEGREKNPGGTRSERRQIVREIDERDRGRPPGEDGVELPHVETSGTEVGGDEEMSPGKRPPGRRAWTGVSSPHLPSPPR